MGAGKQPYSKYKNVKVIVDGIKFDSKGEANRSQELELLQKAGEIKNLNRQVRIPCIINSVKVFTYVADFMYYDNRLGKNVIEDFKGMLTDVFKLKQKILEAQGLHITIIKKPKKAL